MREAMMSERGGESKRSKLEVRPEVVTMLKGMTEGVLSRLGFPDDDPTPTPVVLFKIAKPGREHGMIVYSIAEGKAGFNVSTAPPPGDDISRRWVTYVDRGTNFAAVHNNRGAIYEHGGFDPRHAPYRDHGTLAMREMDSLVSDFFNNPDGTVEVTLLNDDYGVAAEFGPVALGTTPMETPA